MPIDLADYTKQIRDAIRRGGYACIYIASIASPPLSRIGYSEDLVATIGRLQRTIPVPLIVESALWVPSRAIATNISKAVQCDLIANKGQGGWLTCEANAAQLAVDLAAFRIYPGASMLQHSDLMARWKAKAA